MRAFAFAGLVLTLLVVAVLGALVFLRVPAAQFGLDWAAGKFGPPGARATVEDVDLTRLALTDLSLGEQAEVTAKRVTATVRPGSLLKDKIDEVVLDGLTLALDLRPGAQPLGSLQPLVDDAQSGGGSTDAPIVEVPLVRFRDSRVTAETPQGSLVLDFDGSLTQGPDRAATLEFEGELTSDLAGDLAVAPLKVSGRAERRGDAVTASGQVASTAGVALAEVTATHDLATTSGQTEIALAPLRFAPDGLQPADLSPLLAAITEVAGQAGGSAELAWGPEGLNGTAELALDDLAFASGELRVAGLELRLALDRLRPPSSPPQQVLRARLVDLGVPIRNLDARFRLPPDAPGQVLVERASFATVGSRFTLQNALIDPAGAAIESQLRVDELDVAVLFDLLAVDGLSGSGALTGSIPFRRDGETLTIENARLAAEGPGRLRFQSEAAAEALKGGGEQVDLAVRALEDFRYETLTVRADLDPSGEAKLRLEILGHNPAVLDGHPFRFNINVTGNPEPLLESLLLSRTLIENILRRARTLSP